MLCDLALRGGEDGLAVVERLKRAHGASLPCAYVTGEVASDLVERARGGGYPIAFEPARPAKLRALVEHLLDRR